MGLTKPVLLLDEMSAKPLPCPICNKPLEAGAAESSPVFPFCSSRCRQVDLMRWMDGRYAVVERLDPARLSDALAEGDEGAESS